MKQADSDLKGELEGMEIKISRHPEFFQYHEQRGDVLARMGEKYAAIECFLRATALNPRAKWLDVKLRKLLRRNGFAGRYVRYPDLTGKRQMEGGQRVLGRLRDSQPAAPLVSIVTVVYDNDITLQRCIDSVRTQTHGNVEYIVIDGGSPKATLDIIRTNEDIVDYYISEPDGGIYSAMNKGIQLAHGDYICLLNSDDFYAPDFVSQTLRAAQEGEDQTGRPIDVVYTDYHQGNSHLVAQEIDAGLLFGHLHVCHNTFLARASAYDSVGLFDEDFRIVSDAIWMRKSFLNSLQFWRLNVPLFTLVEGGMSSGNTEERRKLFISEAARSYRLNFPQLSLQDAEAIYLFRFNKARIPELLAIVHRYRNEAAIHRALRGYVTHCLRDRANFRFSAKEDDALITDLCVLVDLLEIDLRCLQLETHRGPLAEELARLDAVLARRKPAARRRLLHFISVFSAPSETFVYDLLQRLEAEPEYDNFILFEHPQLRDERPYDKGLLVPWSAFHPAIGARIYKHVAQQLEPTAVIAHFALNEWKWAQRIEGLGLDIPTLSMCHGIDAFAMRDKLDYKAHVVEKFARRHNTGFTAVSNYLANELRAHGVPDDKITLVHNTVNPRFFAHRKTSGFYDGKRRLQLVSIGRLVKFKGHHHLIRGLAEFCARVTRNIHLTLVYGRGDEQLASLRALAEELGIAGKVSFKDFVDFNAQPDFLAGFDLFVHPSTYSDDGQERSETFGVAFLEAIAAGLPIITTDAGGLPEVVGATETPFATIVTHGDAGAVAQALEQMWRDGRAFGDNLAYATERLDHFSARRQIALLGEVLDRIGAKPIKVALFSSSTIQGAGYAAYRLHKGLRATRISSTLFTTARNHEGDLDVMRVAHPSGDGKAWRSLQGKPRPGLTIMTLNQTHIFSEDLLKLVQPYDIINLHWYARFLSAENIATLTWSNKPVVMTIRDMLPITGGCHYFHGCEKWKSDCSSCPQINSKYIHFPSQVLAAKRKFYNFDNLTLVTLSQHTRRIIEQAPIFRNCRIETIPNSIELDVFRPHDRCTQRKQLGLPIDRPIIAYVPSFSSEAKGYKQIIEALDHLHAIDPALDPFILLIGNETPATERIHFDKKSLGYISDNDQLSKAYSAADVVVVPSLEETFSNTAAEAIACGTPIVGFKTGAIPELAVNGKTGFACDIGDTICLARCLSKILRGPDLRRECRQHAEQMLPFHLQAHRYQELFSELICAKKVVPLDSTKIFNLFEKSGLTLNLIASEMLC